MKEIRWSYLKSERLKKVRGLSFEDIIKAELAAVKVNPAKRGQKLMLFLYKRYIWVVPFVEDEDHIFLKTLFPSRKYTKLFKEDKLNEKD